MGVSYQAVQWNRQKRIYDGIMLGLIGLYLILFVGMQLFLFPTISPETLIIRASGSLAFLMLHVILLIGPLARIQPRLLPMLYNRRHLGVSMFLFALIHGLFSLIQFHAFGKINPIASLFLSNLHYGSIQDFPFQTLGFFALIILFLMAASSHDFWLANLSPRLWKALHMMVYFAYGLIIMHVMLGVFQERGSLVSAGFIGLGFVIISGLHITAGLKSSKLKEGKEKSDGFVKAVEVSEIPENKATIITIEGEDIAIFKYEGKISAVSNVCKHQNGPLGEGKIIDGCITCPWHGWQYKPDDGCSPPPFEEKVPTYQAKIKNGFVWVDPKALPEGTFVEPALIP